ncbi:MAG: glycosyltransferase family 39 protein [Nitrosomonas ureae]
MAQGKWTTADYNGALRYGFNLPAAGFMALFGENLFVANLWPLICSLIEIGAVFMFANAAIDRRTAIFASLLLASAPLHIAVATRIHADPVVSMFVTLSFVILYFGLTRNSKFLLFSAGLAIGGIFCAKELAAVTWFAFFPLLWIFREQWRNVFFVVAGALLMMLLHGMIMYSIAGDPLHLVKVVTGALQRNFIGALQGEDGAFYYLKYLFIDLRHTGLLGIFALISIVVLARVRHLSNQSLPIVYVLVWWLGLLIFLSVLPVSLSPLRFPMKQSNYITLFLAPIALLASIAIAAFPRSIGRVLLAASIFMGVAFSFLQQADYRMFTANTKALAEFASEHPGSVIVGSVNNSNLGNLWAAEISPGIKSAKILSFRDLKIKKDSTHQLLLEADTIYVALDRQTMNWISKSPIDEPLDCWVLEKRIVPTGLGIGNMLAKFLGDTLISLTPISTALASLAAPKNADIYRVEGRNVMCSK